MKEYLPDENVLLLSRDEVRTFDNWAINTLGIAGAVLMENAGRSCVRLIKEELSNVASPKVCIFCGAGNNGGDGYVIARHLINAGFEVRVILCADIEKIRGDAKTNLDILERLGHTIERLDINSPDLQAQIRPYTASADMIVDAIFGTGLSGTVRQDYHKLIEAINSLGIAVLAVDIPSGLDCDTGRPLGTAIKANWTVTFVAVKKGFACGRAADYTGRIYIGSIGAEPADKKPD